MNIVERSTDDLTLDEAVRVAGRCAKTLRRAVQDGQLPRRYAQSPRGPQLVFDRDVLEHWLAGRPGRMADGRRALHRGLEALPAAPGGPSAVTARVVELQYALQRGQDNLERALAALGEQQALLAELTQRMTQFTTQAQDAPRTAGPAGDASAE